MFLKTCLRYFLVLCSFYWTASAQSRPASHGTFKIGLSYSETVQRMGKLPRGGYVRRTQANEYKINLRYSPDDSESRLHPTSRLESAEIIADRPTSAKELLQDIPEAVELCKSGCALLAVLVDSVGNYEPHIIAYVEHPTDEQSAMATLIATHWRPANATVQWVPAIILRWKTTLPPSVVPDWLNQPIETATFTPIAPSVETHRRSNFVEQPAFEVGTWTPLVRPK